MSEGEEQQSRSDEGADTSRPKSFLVICNIGKKGNVRTLINSALAFGAHILIVGLPTFELKSHVDRDMHERVSAPGGLTRFEDLATCKDYVHQQGAVLTGVEIVEGAANVEQEPFSGATAFMMGNEGDGMSDKQKSMCDNFCIISQYGTGTASLNVAVAASIVLQRFFQWTTAAQSTSISPAESPEGG